MEVVKPVGFPARYVAVGAVSMLAVALAWLVYSWPVTVQYFPTYAVTYSKGLGQSFELEVVNETGHPVHFCASMYGWLPNGSFAEIGKGCGVGRRSFNPKALRQYAEAWRGYKGVEPGVTVLLTYLNGTKPDSKPTLARTAESFTIQPERVARGENVKATIKVKAKPPKEHNKPSEQANTELGSLSLSWPPRDILRNCTTDPGSGMVNCYVWVLETVYYSMLDTKVPIVAARIRSTTDARYIDEIDLYFVIDATTSTAVYFSAGAVISFTSARDSGPGYSANVYTIVLRNTRLGNDTDTHGIGYFRPRGQPGVYVVGFYGDVALVRYREYVVSYPSGFASPTGYVVDIYYVRPSAARMQRNVIALFEDVDPTPTDNSGYSQIFNRMSNHWSANYKWGDQAIRVSSFTVINEVRGTPELFIGLPPIRLPPGVDVFLTAAAGVGISGGSSTNIVVLARLKASLRESYEDVLDIEGWYYYPYAKFKFGGGSYRIPSIFMDLRTWPQNAR
ncbi:MAG: hypothetical protein ACO2PM_26325 [Pyrobaculum sp.]|jgi:hypothetical protein